LNQSLGSGAFILPGILADTVDEDWLNTHDEILSEAQSTDPGMPIFATCAFSSDALRNNDQVASFIEHAEKWGPDGYYLVFEHAEGNYLVDNPQWIANMLDICASLRMLGKRVIVGYSNQQTLIAAVAKVEAIASGTWMNVRSFPPEKFRSTYEDEIKQRSIWYYCPQALSEYKLSYLDIAYSLGMLETLATPSALNGGYVDVLFRGPQPTAVGLTEQAAFRHFLHALRTQVRSCVKPSLDATIAHHNELLDVAQDTLQRLRSAGVFGQFREFTECIEAHRSALSLFTAQRAPTLRRKWASL